MKTFRNGKLLWTLAAAGYLALAGYLLTTAEKEGDAAGGGRSRRLVLAVPSGVSVTPVYREAVAAFEREHPDISVRILEIGGNFYQKVTVLIAGGSPPDLMWMGQSFSEFADRDVFLDVTDKVKREIDISEYPPEILALYRQSGRYFGLPFGIDASFLVYNRRLFREAGLDDPSDDWTYAQFLDAARRLTRRDEDGRVERFGFNGALPMEPFGARVFNPATGLADCDTPEMLGYFHTNLDLMHRERVIPTAVERGEMGGDMIALFRRERIAMMLGLTMRWDRLYEQLADMDWGMTLCPRVNTQGQWASSQALCISRDTRDADAAWMLLRHFQHREFQIAMGVRSIPARRDYARAFIAEREKTSPPRNFGVMRKVMTMLRPTPRVAHLQELMAVYERFASAILAGRTTPEKGMTDCAAEINRRVDKIRDRDHAPEAKP